MRYSASPVLQFYKLTPTAILPKKAHTGSFEDAAFDLFWSEDSDLVIRAGERCLVPTNLACAIPEGYWVKFHERSGLANKHGLEVYAGVIDSGYTGEWRVILHNSGMCSVVIKPAMAIAQFTVEEVIPVQIQEVGFAAFEIEKSKRLRQEKGFGSSTK